MDVCNAKQKRIGSARRVLARSSELMSSKLGMVEHTKDSSKVEEETRGSLELTGQSG